MSSIIFQRQLVFLHSFSAMSPNSLPLQLMLLRLSSLPRKGLIFHLQHILAELSLPSLSDILRGNWSRSVWKCQVKSITLGREFSQFLDTCDHLPLSRCLLSLGKSVPHWAVTRGYPKLSRLNNYRVRLLVGCDGLEADASRFRSRRFCQAPVGNSTCPLCHQDREDASHIIARCSALATERERLLRGRDELLRMLHSDPSKFSDVIMGVE